MIASRDPQPAGSNTSGLASPDPGASAPAQSVVRPDRPVAIEVNKVTKRFETASGRGVVAVVSTWSIVLGTLGHFSLGQVALQRRSAGTAADLGTNLGSLLAFGGVVSVVAWAALALVAAPLNGISDTVPVWAVALGVLAAAAGFAILRGLVGAAVAMGLSLRSLVMFRALPRPR